MRERTQLEIEADKRRIRAERMRRLLGNFAVVFVCVFFFVTLTHRAALDAADNFSARNKSAAGIEADYDIPLPVEKPPKGGGWLLNRANLRWLRCEEIRLEAMRSVVNFDNERAIKEYIAETWAFNAVAKNCFCEIADLKAAWADVEPFRATIEETAHFEAQTNGWDSWR